MHNGPVRQASNMAATQKPQHILGTTVMLCSQGGLGKGGVPSLESHSPYQRRSTVRHFHEDRKRGQTVQGHIPYITEMEKMEELVQTVRGF